jgi:phosphate uptake regulator
MYGGSMEIRKVQKLGYSTIVVSLPRTWVKEKQIKKGDSVIVRIEEDGSLRIIPYNVGGEKDLYERYIVDVSKMTSMGIVERILIGSYLLGHDTITFKSEDKRIPAWVVEEIMDGIGRLAGVEIVDQRLNAITVQCFIDPTKFKLKGLVRRMYTLIFSMIEGIRIYLTEGDDTIFSQISGMETEADRLYWLIVRQLLLSQRSWRVAKEIGITHPYHLVGNRAIVKALEDIADRINDVGVELRRIPRDWIDKERGKEDGVVRKLDAFLSEVDEMVGDSMQSFIELNIYGANDVINNAKKIKDKTKELDIWFLSSVDDPVVLSSLRLILSHLMRVIDNVQLIAEITFNRSLETPSEYYFWEAVEKKEEVAK